MSLEDVLLSPSWNGRKKSRRASAERQEAALLAALRRMAPRDRVRLLRAAKLAKCGSAERNPHQSSTERLWLTP